jgi:hypothetical protein
MRCSAVRHIMRDAFKKLILGWTLLWNNPWLMDFFWAVSDNDTVSLQWGERISLRPAGRLRYSSDTHSYVISGSIFIPDSPAIFISSTKRHSSQNRPPSWTISAVALHYTVIPPLCPSGSGTCTVLSGVYTEEFVVELKCCRSWKPTASCWGKKFAVLYLSPCIRLHIIVRGYFVLFVYDLMEVGVCGTT